MNTTNATTDQQALREAIDYLARKAECFEEGTPSHAAYARAANQVEGLRLAAGQRILTVAQAQAFRDAQVIANNLGGRVTQRTDETVAEMLSTGGVDVHEARNNGWRNESYATLDAFARAYGLDS